MISVIIPYSPRHPGVHETLESRRFVVLVAHRRFGKTVLAVNHLLKSALLCGRERGSFAYVAPFRNQAREIAWAYLKHYSAALPGREAVLPDGEEAPYGICMFEDGTTYLPESCLLSLLNLFRVG